MPQQRAPEPHHRQTARALRIAALGAGGRRFIGQSWKGSYVRALISPRSPEHSPDRRHQAAAPPGHFTHDPVGTGIPPGGRRLHSGGQALTPAMLVTPAMLEQQLAPGLRPFPIRDPEVSPGAFRLEAEVGSGKPTTGAVTFDDGYRDVYDQRAAAAPQERDPCRRVCRHGSRRDTQSADTRSPLPVLRRPSPAWRSPGRELVRRAAFAPAAGRRGRRLRRALHVYRHSAVHTLGPKPSASSGTSRKRSPCRRRNWRGCLPWTGP